jgi:hypothetical protein
MEIIPVELRKCLSNALMKFDGAVIENVRKDLYRVLKTSEEQGWTWSVREMYGGGKEVSVWDGHDDIAYVQILDYMEDKANVSVQFMAEYLTAGFEPTELMPYNEELDAEMRNEEALYKYEMPRPWRDAWYVQKKRQWDVADVA